MIFPPNSFIVYLFYLYLLIFLYIDCFKNPNILEDDFKAICLTFTEKIELIFLYLLISGVSIVTINIVC